MAVPVVLFIGHTIQTHGTIYPQSTYAYTKEKDPNKKRSDYLFFIRDGDKYIEEEKWHNAIFQYTEALKLFPKEFDANYRLSLAYSYSCSYEGKKLQGSKLYTRQTCTGISKQKRNPRAKKYLV